MMGSQILKHPLLNSWNLFWLIIGSISVLSFWELAQSNLQEPEEIKALIRFSVRASVPWLLLAFGASTLVYLWPSSWTRWNLRNRRVLGLSFTAVMMWQLVFIGIMIGTHGWDFFITKVSVPADLVSQVIGYAIIAAMTVTSFDWGRKQISLRQWRILHTTGIYLLWLAPWTSYVGLVALGHVTFWAVFYGTWSTVIMVLKLYVVYAKRQRQLA